MADDAESSSSNFSSIGELALSLGVVTAVAFLFSWAKTEAMYDYCGMHPSVLGYSVQDFVIRSGSAFIALLTIVLLAALAVIHLGSSENLRRWSQERRVQRLMLVVAVLLV